MMNKSFVSAVYFLRRYDFSLIQDKQGVPLVWIPTLYRCGEVVLLEKVL